MKLKSFFKVLTFFLIFLVLFWTYYYLPSQKKGSIQVEKIEKDLEIDDKNKNTKNTFFNTEYKTQNKNGKIFTTRAQKSLIYQSQQNLIYLIQPYSFTIIEKDQSLLEIKSDDGLYDKNENTIFYNKNVIINNKNYLITANSAKHFSSKNKILISGDVIMKDLNMGLSHIAYSDFLEINTINNNVIAYMDSNNKNVIAKKFK